MRTTNTSTIRVLLTDDHDLVRAGLRALLEAAGDMCVVGEAANGQQAVCETERLRPQVVVLDLAMPLLNGVEAARQIALKVPAARVLILSSYSDAQHLRQAVAAGVAGYLVKQSAADDLLAAIRETCHGGAFFSPGILHLLSQEKRPQTDRGVATTTAALTQRQAEVLQLVAEGYANKHIASLLSLSIKTVEKHRQALMEKLHLHNTAALTRYAVASAVVEMTSPHDWLGTSPPVLGSRRHQSAAQPRPRAAAAPGVGLLAREHPATAPQFRPNDPLASALSRLASPRKAVSITWNQRSASGSEPVRIWQESQ